MGPQKSMVPRPQFGVAHPRLLLSAFAPMLRMTRLLKIKTLAGRTDQQVGMLDVAIRLATIGQDDISGRHPI